jgi:benzoyl-CoA-dihydrodiol lyase
MVVDFRTEPSRYKHWKLAVDGRVATLSMDVSEAGGLVPGYELKLNSYDLGVDIELYDAVQRLRFEHPEVGAVLLTSAKERVFCAGANIRMLGKSSHGWKVNFCKFTNETRNSLEEASTESGQTWVLHGQRTVRGRRLRAGAGLPAHRDGGRRQHVRRAAEVPLLAVLPGTGGLTRLTDKRKVRRDRADYFCTLEEGVKGKRAVEWNLVDEVVPRTKLEQTARTRRRSWPRAAIGRPTRGHRAHAARAHDRRRPHRLPLGDVRDRSRRGVAEITVAAPDAPPPADAAGVQAQGVAFWPLAVARELDDLILSPAGQRGDDRALGAEDTGSADLVEATTACWSSTPRTGSSARSVSTSSGR